jgi:predicted NBD/HSP70 family sugar kinase
MKNKENLLSSSLKRGTNLQSVRSYNEKLVLQLIREHGELSKAEATIATGLSANAMSQIFRTLESSNLLKRGKPIRGRIGQPSTPLSINGKANYYLALNIARRSVELSVIDFTGQILQSCRERYEFPIPAKILQFVKSNFNDVVKTAKLELKDINSLGVAMPFELWSWTEMYSSPADLLDQWRDFDISTALEQICNLDVLVENDATAACRSELVFGSHIEREDWIYFYIDTFIGGGIVLNGSVFPGRRGNAGGFGPMRVPHHREGNRLIDHASLIVLEREIVKKGIDPLSCYIENQNWNDFEPMLSDWITRAANNISHAIVSSLSVMDFEAAVIDGSFPEEVKNRLVNQVDKFLNETDLQGVHKPEIISGQIGAKAQSKGAAASIISKDYLIDNNTLHRG